MCHLLTIMQSDVIFHGNFFFFFYCCLKLSQIYQKNKLQRFSLNLIKISAYIWFFFFLLLFLRQYANLHHSSFNWLFYHEYMLFIFTLYLVLTYVYNNFVVLRNNAFFHNLKVIKLDKMILTTVEYSSIKKHISHGFYVCF